MHPNTFCFDFLSFVTPCGPLARGTGTYARPPHRAKRALGRVKCLFVEYEVVLGSVTLV